MLLRKLYLVSKTNEQNILSAVVIETIQYTVFKKQNKNNIWRLSTLNENGWIP